MKYSKFAYTLAEMLICLAIISVVVAMVIPAAMSKKPAKNKALFRKAYYNLERAVQEMVNDESIFPSTKADDFASADLDRSTLFAYFIPDKVISNPSKYGYSAANINELKVTLSPNDRTIVNRKRGTTGQFFCTQLAKRLNTTGKVQCMKRRYIAGDNWPIVFDDPDSSRSPSFVTNDGVVWIMNPLPHFCVREELPDGTIKYRSGDTESTCHHKTASNNDLDVISNGGDYGSDYMCIELDVNGEAPPNRRTNTHDPDRFRVCVYYDGRIQIPKGTKENPSKESLYLESNKIID